MLDDPRGRDLLVGHVRRVVLVRVGDQRPVLHIGQHHIPVPLRAVRFHFVDTGVHLAAERFEHVLQRPRRNCKEVEQHALDGEFPEEGREAVPGRKAV